MKMYMAVIWLLSTTVLVHSMQEGDLAPTISQRDLVWVCPRAFAYHHRQHHSPPFGYSVTRAHFLTMRNVGADATIEQTLLQEDVLKAAFNDLAVVRAARENLFKEWGLTRQAVSE